MLTGLRIVLPNVKLQISGMCGGELGCWGVRGFNLCADYYIRTPKGPHHPLVNDHHAIVYDNYCTTIKCFLETILTNNLTSFQSIIL